MEPVQKSRLTELRERVNSTRLEKEGLSKRLADPSLNGGLRQQARSRYKAIVVELSKMKSELEDAIESTKRGLAAEDTRSAMERRMKDRP
jgi:hypothetical protein